MGSDPKKPNLQDEDHDEGSTAMFSREAHGWFSSMADNQETDPNSVADLGRNAVIESSPLSRTGGLPPASKVGAPGSSRVLTPVPPPVASVASPSLPRPAPASLASGAASPLAKLDGKQVVVLAFVGGAVVAALVGLLAFFLLTPR
jgi:hypothetical protein